MFPKEEVLRQTWFEKCTNDLDLKTSNDLHKTNLRICGRHFENHLFKNPKTKARLKPNAVPTLFPSNDKKCKFLTILNYIIYNKLVQILTIFIVKG